MEQRQGPGYPVSEYSQSYFIDFSLRFDHKKYALGWQIFCDSCNKPCYSSMSFYPCRNTFVVDRVRCHLGCGKTWRLKIDCEKPICH
jgi:hypothetical protein